MFDLKAYLDSGIIENYCLGLTSAAEAAQLEAHCLKYREVQEALTLAQENLEQYFWAYQKDAKQGVEDDLLKNVEDDYDLSISQLSASNAKMDKFIPISTHSDYQKWLKLTEELQPPAQFDIHFHELYRDQKNLLCVVWIKDFIPEEKHDTLMESILCLEGTCEGTLNNCKIPLQAGDFWQVPLHAEHTLKVTSETPVKLILMRQAAV